MTKRSGRNGVGRERERGREWQEKEKERRRREAEREASAAGGDGAQKAKKAKSAQAKQVTLTAEQLDTLPDAELMQMMGLPTGFDSTHEKHVDGADQSAAKVTKKRNVSSFLLIFLLFTLFS